MTLPLVRTAAVDASGHLWVSLRVPVSYIYDPTGEKVRVVQFRGAGVVAPFSLFFAQPGRLLAAPGGYSFNTSAEPENR